MSKLSSTSMDELETEQEMSDSAVTVECRLAYDQDTALQRLHRNRSTDDQLDTENGQTWVVQKLKMSENNSEVNIEEVVCNEKEANIGSNMKSSRSEDSNNDSGISDGSSGATDSDGESADEKVDKNVTNQIAKIDALLAKINNETKKSHEDESHKVLHRAEVKECTKRISNDTADTSSKSRVSFSGSWATDKAEDITWASSMEQKRYPIVVFSPAALSQPSSTPVGSRYHLTFKMVHAEAKICSQLLQAHGFQEVSSSNEDFNIMWTGSHPNPHIFKSMLPHQRVNHFPRSYELTRKDRMYKNIERLQIAKGPKHFNFIPKTFTIPNEYSEFAAAHHRTRGKELTVFQCFMQYLSCCNYLLIFVNAQRPWRFHELYGFLKKYQEIYVTNFND